MVRPWSLPLEIDPAGDPPVFLQIARGVIDDVRRGRLRPGDPLPGSRALAATLGVHRNTVLAAWQELLAEGWIETAPARGTAISRELPDRAPRRLARPRGAARAPSSHAGFDLGPALDPALSAVTSYPRDAIVLEGGIPDVGLAPVDALARAWRRALRQHTRAVLSYGDPRGDLSLRAAIASMVSSLRGVAATADHVIVTRGSQMALDLAARTLLAPGDVVAVEAYGYRPAWEAFRAAGARLVPIAVDAHGIDVAALAAREPVRAVYVTPHHQYPTQRVLSPGRRLALLELARARRMAVLEDDYDHEFHYDGRPVLPLASADDAGVVVYLGTLSKVLAPGLRCGFIVAPPPLVDRLAARRRYIDRQGDLTTERCLAELLDDGTLARHARKTRRIYQSRRDAMVEALTTHFGDAMTFTPPAGGMSVWVTMTDGTDVDAWLADAAARGVFARGARHFAFDGRSRPHARLGFAAHDPRRLREGVKRLAESWRALR